MHIFHVHWFVTVGTVYHHSGHIRLQVALLGRNPTKQITHSNRKVDNYLFRCCSEYISVFTIFPMKLWSTNTCNLLPGDLSHFTAFWYGTLPIYKWIGLVNRFQNLIWTPHCKQKSETLGMCHNSQLVPYSTLKILWQYPLVATV